MGYKNKFKDIIIINKDLAFYYKNRQKYSKIELYQGGNNLTNLNALI